MSKLYKSSDLADFTVGKLYKYIVPAGVTVGIALAFRKSSSKIYEKLVMINNLRRAIQSSDCLSNNKKGMISTIFRTFKIIYMTFVYMFYQKLFGTVQLTKNVSYATYFHNMKWYYVPVITKRGPKLSIIKAFNNTDKGAIDITNLITKLAGPNIDFYGMKLKPEDIDTSSFNIIIETEVEKITIDKGNVIGLD
jgi:hypothetical protein